MTTTKSRSWGLHLTSLLPVNIVQALMAFAGLALYSRLMTPDAYGEYVLAMTAQLLGQFIVFGWLASSIPRFTAQCEAEGSHKTLLTTAYGLFIGMSVIFLVGMAVLLKTPIIPSHYHTLIAVTTLSGVVRSGALIGLEAHRSGLRITRYSLLESFQALGSVILGGLFVYRSEGRPEGIFLALGLMNITTILLDLPWLIRTIHVREFSRVMASRLWGYGSPLMVSTLFCFALAYIDRFILAHLSDKQSVGIFGAAISLAERPMMMGFIWVASASSSLGFHTMEHGKEKDVCKVMQRALETLIALTFPMAVGLMVVAQPISSVLLGAEYHEGVAALLPLVACSTILKGLVNHYLSQFFQLSMRTGLMSLIYTLALVVSIGANLWLVPDLGAVGTLLSSLIAYGVALCIMGWITRQRFKIRLPWLDTLKVSGACYLMYLVVDHLHVANTPEGLIVGVASGVAIYAVAVLTLDIGQWRKSLMNSWRIQKI